MQEVIYNTKLNLLEHFHTNNFKKLIRVFPKLSNIIPLNISSNPKPIIIDKFLFYHMILDKIKNYFELSESFIIAESIDIILKDIKSKEKSKHQSNKSEFPIINYNREIKNLNISKESKSSRNYSTKNETNLNTSSPKMDSLKKIGNEEKASFNTANVNKVYINLEKNRESKMKLVHFIVNKEFDITTKNTSSRQSQKKSNLKPKNNSKLVNQSNSLHFHTMLDNNNIREAKHGQKLIVKTKTEYEMRNKSTGIKKPELSEKIEIKDIDLPDRINKIYEKNLKNFVNIDDKNFNIFEFENKVGKENTLLLIGKYISNYFKFGEVINQSNFDNWVEKIAKGYNRKNHYHHDLHAADIAHTSYIYFRYGLIHEIAKLDTSMICAVIMSCICHDYKHPGVNNNYLIDTNDDIALNYNDISVLENMHISEAFKLMHSNPCYNVFEGLDRDKYKKFRKQMILCVLATDITKHSSSLDFLNKCLSEKNKPEDNDKQDYMDLVIHTADISNPTKIFDIYFKWAKLVVEEFYAQGDQEKKLGLKCSCDRTKVTIYKNQLGFIDFIELPFYSLVVKVFPKLDFLMTNLNDNKERIKKLEEEYNKDNKSSNNNK
jgi:hypothetical protein